MVPIAPLFNWLRARAAGVLLHPTSLPGDQGIGTLDGQVDRLLDFLRGGRDDHLADLPARPHGLRRLAVPVLLGLCGQPLPDRPARPGAEGPPDGGGTGASHPSRSGPRRLWRPLPPEVAAAPAGRRALSQARLPSPRRRELRRVQETLRGLAGRLRLLPRLEGSARRAVLDGLAGRLAHPRRRTPFAAPSRTGGRVRVPSLLPVRLLLAMGAGAGGGGPQGRPDHRRHPDFRRRRLRRRLDPSRALRNRRENGPPGRRRGRAAGLFFGRRPVLGKSPLPVGTPRGRRLRVVAAAPGRGLRAVRHRQDRPFPRLRLLLAGAIAGRQRPDRPMDPGTGDRPVPRPPFRDARSEDHRRGPRRDDPLGRAVAGGNRAARHGRHAVRVRRRRRQPATSRTTSSPIRSSIRARTTTTRRSVGTRQPTKGPATMSGAISGRRQGHRLGFDPQLPTEPSAGWPSSRCRTS